MYNSRKSEITYEKKKRKKVLFFALTLLVIFIFYFSYGKVHFKREIKFSAILVDFTSNHM